MFTALINPFLKEVTIIGNYSFVLSYNDIDEWVLFDYENVNYIFHILYDCDSLSFEIYEDDDEFYVNQLCSTFTVNF